MLLLYTKPWCPYCEKVKTFADENEVAYQEKIASQDTELLAELLEKGGERQFPFLHDTDKEVMMYESDDIITYFQENYIKD